MSIQGPFPEPVDFEQQRVDLAAKKNHTLAVLHQAIWEASQYTSLIEIERFCHDTLHSIQSDQP